MREEELRLQLIEYSKKLKEQGLFERNKGNISIRLDNEYFLVTPENVDINNLKIEDISKVKISDGSYEGAIPSNEYLLHLYIYEYRHDLDSLIHIHDSYLQILSVLREDLKVNDTLYRSSKYALVNTNKMYENVINAMNKTTGALISNHGFIVGSLNIEDCFKKIIEAEDVAKKYLKENRKA